MSMSDQGDMSDCAGPCPGSPQLQLYQTIIFATPVLFALLLLVLFCLLYIRRRRNAVLASQGTVQFMSRGFNPTPAHDRGLSRSSRQRLPIVPFDEKFAASNKDHQCAVCLCDYEMHEKLQQLPVCKHAFHVLCIDEWLANNSTCPICRTLILQGDGTACGPSLTAADNRGWEERIVNEVHTQVDVSNQAESSIPVVPSAGTGPRLSTDHSINIERS